MDFICHLTIVLLRYFENAFIPLQWIVILCQNVPPCNHFQNTKYQRCFAWSINRIEWQHSKVYWLHLNAFTASAYLIRVVRARDQCKNPGKRILCWIWNFLYFWTYLIEKTIKCVTIDGVIKSCRANQCLKQTHLGFWRCEAPHELRNCPVDRTVETQPETENKTYPLIAPLQYMFTVPNSPRMYTVLISPAVVHKLWLYQTKKTTYDKMTRKYTKTTMWSLKWNLNSAVPITHRPGCRGGGLYSRPSTLQSTSNSRSSGIEIGLY